MYLQSDQAHMPSRDENIHSAYKALRSGALFSSPVQGLTHNFYRYPARFSPKFASAAITALSQEGDLVLDPFMGGGTTLVEAAVRSRKAVGVDVSSLALFVSRTKTTALTEHEAASVKQWASTIIPQLSYHDSSGTLENASNDPRCTNLGLARSRPIKKLVLLALSALESLPTEVARDFARCGILASAQWALDGRKSPVPCSSFRERLQATLLQMVAASHGAWTRVHDAGSVEIYKESAHRLSMLPIFQSGQRADLVVTSPPYPGVHVLYHRWQIDGGKETPFPFLIAASKDGHPGSFYTLAARASTDRYFAELKQAFESIRSVTRIGAFVAQLVAFPDPSNQLKRYLRVMNNCGFREARPQSEMGRRLQPRIWRDVPGRRWYASHKGALCSSREVVLLHEAI